MQTPPPPAHGDAGPDEDRGDAAAVTRFLGGPREAVEGAAPSVTFAIAYAVVGSSLTTSLVTALVVSGLVAAVRAIRGESVRLVLGGLAAVAVAAAVAARTGRAEDYFLPSLLANVAAALIWAASVVAGWPLLGVIVGAAAGQRTRWRGDPDLVRGYSRASWIWTASFVLRAAVMMPLYLGGNVLALGVAKVVLGWPMVLAVIWLSWITIRRTLPAGHPGLFAVRRAGAAKKE